MALTCNDGTKIPFDDLVAEINGKLDDIGYGQPGQVLTTNNYRTGYTWRTHDMTCKVDKITGKGLSTNDLTNDMVEVLNQVDRNIHSHNNKNIIDALGQDPLCGELTYNGELVDKKMEGESLLSSDIWSFYYYADPELDRTVIVDPITMTLVGWIPTTEDGHPGSSDRAGHTDRMYIRTGGPSGARLHTYDVVDARTKQFIKAIHLPDPDDPDNEDVGLVPRGCGTFNKYKNLQVISHKLEPMATVIDVNTDRPAAPAVGTKVTTETIDANFDTNATGHSNWLDQYHFTLLDRFRDQILVYKIEEDTGIRGEFTTTLIQTVQLPMCSHVIDEDVQDQTLYRDNYWALIEGSSSMGVAPHVIEYTFSSDSGLLTEGDTATLPNILDTDQVHHYGYWPKYGELWVPTWEAKKTFVIDVNGGASNMLVMNGDGYDTGLGGSHVNFSDTLDLAIVTNHFDTMVHIIDRNGVIYSVEVTQPADVRPVAIGTWRQSHINHVTPDGLFFHLFAMNDGIFVEVDLQKKTVTRILYTGGKPEQSSS